MMRQCMKYLIAVGLVILLSTASAACSVPAPVTGPSAPATLSEPIQTMPVTAGKAVHQVVQLPGKQADGYIIPLKKANIVCVITDVGMAGCGAFDVMILDNYEYPAVKMKSSTANPIATVDDLLAGTVKEVNNTAAKLGIKVGMTGREALDLL